LWGGKEIDRGNKKLENIVWGIEIKKKKKRGTRPLTVHRLFFLFVAFAFCAF
jgi:hypothetical protein